MQSLNPQALHFEAGELYITDEDTLDVGFQNRETPTPGLSFASQKTAKDTQM